MKDTQKSARSTTAIDTTSEGFTDEERGAMKERTQELRVAARRGRRADKADEESAVLAIDTLFRREKVDLLTLSLVDPGGFIAAAGDNRLAPER